MNGINMKGDVNSYLSSPEFLDACNHKNKLKGNDWVEYEKYCYRIFRERIAKESQNSIENEALVL